MNRRDFLKMGAAGVSASMLSGYVANGAEQKTYRVGLIGTGWYGKNDLFRLIQVAPVEVVSLCDVDQHRLSQAAEMVAGRQKSHKTPRTYNDYRQMLKEKDLDIVLVGTPDHWHSLQMIVAVESGADVYVQKPISRDVLEGEAMVAAARKNNRVVQAGTQRKLT
ncbi:MAG TPA: Gfo/Idh/MocA family oxidoreductase, partial [Tepidisphaeraceae bacterium]|nr:Gfo/Idh/MocA family oxidoreductase [Tepidisphaeraceae bacterium]